MKHSALIFALLLKASLISCQQRLDLESFREWRQLDFVFPSAQIRASAIQRKQFVAENAFPIDVDVDYQVSTDRSRIFVTVPRFSEGIPVTLGYVRSRKSQASDLLIQPYPDYSWHSSHGANCDFMTSVVRVAIDDCHRMYVVDTGVIGTTRKCPPQLLVFNLVNDKLLKRYKFPSTQYTDLSLFITPVLDVQDPPPIGNCGNTKVYIADVTGFALIVYDSAINRSWRIQNKLFYPYPSYGTFTIAGESFDLMDGVFGLALTPKKSPDDRSNTLTGSFNRQTERALYFHSLASGHENVVPLRVVNNASIWEANANAEPRAFGELGRRGIQASAQAMDSNGNLFFVLMNPLALACWDSSLPYTHENIKIVIQNDATLQFASGLKVIKNLHGHQELWVLTNRFQKIQTGTLRADEINFRVMLKTVGELLKGQTRCNGQQLNANFLFPTQPPPFFPTAPSFGNHRYPSG